MTVAALEIITRERKAIVFEEIRYLINEVDAIDRALEHLGESCPIDDALAEIIVRLNGEISRARKQIRLRKREQNNAA